LFSGILVCGNCDKKMYVFVRSPKYVCPKCRNKIPIADMDGIFQEQLEQFFVSKERMRRHLESANDTLVEKRQLVESHKKQIEKINGEMRKTYQLFQADQISPDGFGKIYKPLEQQIASLNAELPRLQGELDAIEMRQISAEEVISEASNLHKLWPRFGRDEKRRILGGIPSQASDFYDWEWRKSQFNSAKFRARK
jgi:site-specific DNA recombinase